MRDYDHFGFDCEGVSLGYTGRLCLLQLSDPRQNVYLFDIVEDRRMLSDADSVASSSSSSTYSPLLYSVVNSHSFLFDVAL